MSIMDDVFDVRAALKSGPESKAFKRIEAHMWAQETALDQSEALLTAIKGGALAFKVLFEGKPD